MLQFIQNNQEIVKFTHKNQPIVQFTHNNQSIVQFTHNNKSTGSSLYTQQSIYYPQQPISGTVPNLPSKNYPQKSINGSIYSQ